MDEQVSHVQFVGAIQLNGRSGQSASTQDTPSGKGVKLTVCGTGVLVEDGPILTLVPWPQVKQVFYKHG